MKLKIFKNNNRCNDLTVLSIDSLFDVTSSRRIHASQYKIEGIPFFRGTEINNIKKGIYDYHVFISNEFYDEIKEKYPIPKVGDILITAVGTVGNTLLIEKDFDFYFKDGNIIWLKKKEHKNFNSKYINYFFNTIHGKEKIFGLTGGSAYQALTIKSLSKSNIFLPTISMQNKIVEILEKQEYIISNIEKLISKTEKMFEYFCIKEFDLDNIECRNYQIKDIIIKNPKSTIKAGDIRNSTGNIPAFNSSAKLQYFYDDYLADGENIFLPTGGSASIHYYNGKSCYTTDVFSFRTEKDKVINKYMYYYFKNDLSILDNMFYGAGLKHLNKNELLNYKISIPSLEKQKETVKLLEKQEILIENQKKLLEKEKEKFEWLSEKLLSGEYLVVEDKE